MNNFLSRRQILQTWINLFLITGFDFFSNSRSKLVSAVPTNTTASLNIDDLFYKDDNTKNIASDDFGHLISKRPQAVFKPSSAESVALLIQFARQNNIKIAARGQGHSTYGQSQVENGIVIDMSSLNTIHLIDEDKAIVDAGVVWSQLLQNTLEKELTPPVLTDYLGLSVGGTLSVGGMGGAAHRFGLQVDNVLELLVATGAGKLETCSRSKNRELFEAILAGLGQCGIIIKATIRLTKAEKNVRLFSLFYENLKDFINEQHLLIAQERFNYVKGQVIPNPKGGWLYMLEGASFWTQPNEPNKTTLLADLSYIQGIEKIEDSSYSDFANRLIPIVVQFKSEGSWSQAHPWFDVFIPGSKVEQYVGEILSSLTINDTGNGVILLYPFKTKLLTMPLSRVPNEPVAFLFDILRNAPQDSTTIANLLDSNRKLFEQNRNQGGYRYPIGSIPISQNDWVQHFGSRWSKLVSMKRQYDPNNILTPGQGIF